MFIRRLTLENFRSWKHLDLELEPGITVFLGKNGQGKTNLIEAIAYAAVLSSHRVSSDNALISDEELVATVAATAVNNGRELTVALQLNREGSNKATINGVVTKPLRNVRGVVSAVLFAPEDLELVRGEPNRRRRFLDDLLLQRLPRYATIKSDYDRVLKQRSALLKSASALSRRPGKGDGLASLMTSLDVWDRQLASTGSKVVAERLRLVDALRPFLQDAYHQLAPQSEAIDLEYVSSIGLTPKGHLATEDSLAEATQEWDEAILEERMLEVLNDHRHKEIERGVSLIGPHRDDIMLTIGAQPAKSHASHGESWSLSLSLRLGSFNLLRFDGPEPILLLDDVLSELDRHRRRALMSVVHETEQVLITVADGDSIPGLSQSDAEINHAEGSETGEMSIYNVVKETDTQGSYHSTVRVVL